MTHALGARLLATRSHPDPDPEASLQALELLVGATRRLFMGGPDSLGDRARCVALVERVLSAGPLKQAPWVRYATLADWWLQNALGRSPTGLTWKIGEHLPHWLTEGMEAATRQAAGGLPLVRLRRPLQFREATTALAALLEHPASINLTPGPDIYREAREGAHSVLRAAEEGQPAPVGLDVLIKNTELWAGEKRGTHALQHGLKVWNTLKKHLDQLQGHCQRLVACWCLEPVPQPVLIGGWRELLADDFPERPALAAAWLADLGALDAEPAAEPEWQRPRRVLEALHDLDAELGPHLRMRLLTVGREAATTDPTAPRPVWMDEARDMQASLREQVSVLRERANALGERDALEALDVSLQQIEDFETAEAEDWIREASATLDSRQEGDETAVLIDAMATRIADLSAAGWADEDAGLRADVSGPATGEELARRAAAVESAWKRRQTELRSWVGRAEQELARRPIDELSRRARTTLATAREALKSKLAETARGMHEVQGTLDALVRADEERFGPKLTSLATRARKTRLPSTELTALEAAIRRVRLRTSHELPAESLLEQLDTLVSAFERGAGSSRPLLAVCTDRWQGGDRLVETVCWVDGGLERDPSDSELRVPDPKQSLRGGDLVVITESQGGRVRLDGPPPVGRFAAAVDRTRISPELLERLARRAKATVFVRDQGTYEGPYQVVEAELQPADERGFVARLDAETFEGLFGVLACRPAKVRLVADPPDLDELLDQDAAPGDPMGAARTELWLKNLLQQFDLSGVDGEALSKLMRGLEVATLPEALRTRRIAALRSLVETSRQLAGERAAAADAFLATEEGAREVQRAASRLAEGRLGDIEREVEARRGELAGELKQLDEQVARREEQLETVVEDVRRRRSELDADLVAMKADLSALEEMRQDGKTQLLAELFGARFGAGHVPPVAASVVRSGARTTSLSTVEVATLKPTVRPRLLDLATVADELVAAMAPMERYDVANLLAVLLTSRWTLLAGAPGVGKSTLARDFLTALGHGSDEGRMLDVVVRRDWHDDAALFGFWHPERRTWVPGSEGLLEHLVDASEASERGAGLLSSVLFEELNLASPEYYLSRLIAALEDRTPRLRLYGSENANGEPATGVPPVIPVGENVRLLGTMNVDETVERLSPRFLSRAHVLWLEPRVEAFFVPSSSSPAPTAPIDWDALVAESRSLPVTDEEPIKELAMWMHDHRVPGAPTRRTVLAIRKYLAVADRLMPPAVSRDFAVTQLVLPSVRGVGDVLGELADLFKRRNWNTAADRCGRLRERGRQLGHYYDFFHG